MLRCNATDRAEFRVGKLGWALLVGGRPEIRQSLLALQDILCLGWFLLAPMRHVSVENAMSASNTSLEEHQGEREANMKKSPEVVVGGRKAE